MISYGIGAAGSIGNQRERSGMTADLARTTDQRVTDGTQKVQPIRDLTPARERIGAYLIIATMVGIQFVDVNFISIGEFQLTLQKLGPAVILPLGALLIGRIQISLPLATIGALYLLTFSISWIGGEPNPDFSRSFLQALLNIVAAMVLFTALCGRTENVVFLARVWVTLAVFSATVSILQFIHILPLFIVPDDLAQVRQGIDGGLTRATGFKLDPNFQAVILTVGLVFGRGIKHPVARMVFSAIILLGIVSTLSRMGTLIALVIIALTRAAGSESSNTLPHSKSSRRIFSKAANVGVITLIVYAVFLILPGPLQEYAGKRFSDLWRSIISFGQIGETRDAVSSGESRVLLLKQAVEVIRENWLIGVGPGDRVLELNFQAGGLLNAVHNSYLEMIVVGGMVGLVTVLAVFWVCWTTVRARVGDQDEPFEATATRMTMVVFGVFCLFLSFLYNSIFWVLFAVWMAVRQTGSSGWPNTLREETSAMRY